MTSESPHVLIVGAGSAGLMAAHELSRAGTRVTVLEARGRCGGRIWPLSAQDFGYTAEAGAEFVHGEAPVTGALAKAAGLRLSVTAGTRWNAERGTLSRDTAPPPHAHEMRAALAELRQDLPLAEFLETRFGGEEHAELRREITHMVEGYDAADPRRVSTFAIRDEWLAEGLDRSRRIDGGYGALIEFLAAECRRRGVAIRLNAPVAAVRSEGRRVTLRTAGGDTIEGDAAILAVPLPLLSEIELPADARHRADVALGTIGFGNVVKLLFRFCSRWWIDDGPDRDDLSFVFSEAFVPTWWTQYPAPDPVLTGWLAGPKAAQANTMSEVELIAAGFDSLAEIFGRPVDTLRRDLVTARAINWGVDPFARGAYSYATPATADTKALFREPSQERVFFCGEAFYAGTDLATVEAALASGQETARSVLVHAE